MPRENWDRIQEIFLEAADLPASDRAAFLDRACSDDPEIRAEVESLLRADAGASSEPALCAVIESTAASVLEESSLVGARLGPYRLLREIGQGGMGSVYLAERDDEHYRKHVAVKVVKYGMDTAGVLARFRHERQILAGFEHPYIARLIDGGTTPDGRPFLVMEYVEGQPIVAYGQAHDLDLESRLRLFLRVCEAVSYAHRALVVHRDLKPNNILVTGEGIPKLLDFGVAKLLDPRVDPGLTSTSLHIGMFTPAYASPEQVRGLPITPVVDVYALGAILFELLTGSRAQKMDTSTPSEIERVVCQTEVQRPSIAARAAGRPRLKSDLDNIVLMAMRKESKRRYQSVDELARDIECYLDNRPLLAEGDSWADRTQKFVRRRRGPILAGAACAVVMLLAYLFRPAMPLPQVSRIVQLTKSGGARQLEPLFTDGPRVYYQSIGAAAADWQTRQVLLNGNEDTPVGIPGGRFRVQGLSPDDTEFLAIDLSDEHRSVWTIPVTSGGSPRRVNNLTADDISWSHDGGWLAYSQNNRLCLAKPDGTSSRPLATVSFLSGSIDHIRWAPDDRLLRFTVLTPTTQAIWEVGADGRNLHELRFKWPGDPTECCGEWTPDGRYFVFSSRREGTSNLWLLEEKSNWWRRANRDPIQMTSGPVNYYQPISSRKGKNIFAVGVQPSGELVRYDESRRDFLPFLVGGSFSHVTFTRDRQWLAYVDYPEGTLWRARSDGTQRLQLTFPPLHVVVPQWSSDGKRIAFTATQQGQGWRNFVISAEGGNPEPFPSEPRSQSSAAWMPERDTLIYSRAYGAENPELLRYDLRSGRIEKIPGTDGLYGAAWSPNGHYLCAIDAATDALFLVDLKSGKRTQITGPARFPTWSPDSQYLYFVRDRVRWILRVRVPDGKEERVLEIPFRLAAWPFTLAPEGSLIMLRERGRYDVYSLALSLP